MQRHSVVEDDGSWKQTQNWQEEVKVSDKHSVYSEHFIKMLTAF